MQIKARRQQRANREVILGAARAIARREGWSAVTIRTIADEVHYTSPIIYEHFRNKKEALTEVLRQGFRDLEAAMRHSVSKTADPSDRLVAMADAYWSFGQAQPEVYQIMHGMGGAALDPAETARGAEAVCHLALEAVKDWAAANEVELEDPLQTTELLWCVLHGVTSLGLGDRLGRDGSDRTRAMVRRAVSDLMAGWRASRGAS